MYKRVEYLNNDTDEVIAIAYASQTDIFFIEEFQGKKVSMIPSDNDFKMIADDLSSHACRFECVGLDSMTEADIDDLFSPFLSKERMDELRAELMQEEDDFDSLFDEDGFDFSELD